MFLWGGVLDQTGTGGGGGGGTVGLLIWAEDSQLLSDVTGGSPVGHGANVERWLAEDSTNALDQTNTGSQPLADIDSAFPGRSGLVFSAAKHLAGPVAAAPGTILIIVGPQGSLPATLVSRDTSQATTAPAFSIAVEETF